MHFYSFNIGDYISHTKHLSDLEDLAYRRLLDLYYLHERTLNEDVSLVARKINMKDNVPEVRVVLEEFFKLEIGKGWINPRADEEIQKYQGKIQSAIRAGKASALARSNASSTMVQPNKKQETLNKKQETNIKRPRNVSKKTWDDFLVHRKNKKAPLTETALKGIKNEVKKTSISLEDALVMCQARGWQSFKSDWVADKQKSFATTSYGEGEQEI
ncbi:Uncharacterized protein conserved in bacteria (COG3756) [uncultured Mediterranean phage uvMED]|nr:Uncharacterized protein conserved in bacteria (COG3756) [uncultured Mediterranean phage uvMED]